MRLVSTPPLWGLLALAMCQPIVALSAPMGGAVPLVNKVASPVFVSITEVSVPVLEDVLRVFAAGRAQPWRAYDGVADVQWHQWDPQENTEMAEAQLRFSRSGAVLLAGFGMNLLSDASAVDGLRMGDEGESGLTLFGDAAHVHEIAVMKFYPSDDHIDILLRQFSYSPSIEVHSVSPSIERGTHASSIYRVQMPGLATIHADAFVDEAGSSAGPGSTTFVFFTGSPDERVAATRCREG